ncbi:hypothetical protein GCM10010497_20680 [Streptomyces cinereoruber]|uniref:Uncharacterized protein n=1 Tax=Streptomyces cinereoruber TaxID=67260 RepID=A0AAV4KHW6_9ACTN|nr:hypothetical protein GCM10010497_20680 [Streptomyces cinereoruber]
MADGRPEDGRKAADGQLTAGPRSGRAARAPGLSPQSPPTPSILLYLETSVSIQGDRRMDHDELLSERPLASAAPATRRDPDDRNPKG